MFLIQLLLPATAGAISGDAAMLALTRAELTERFTDVTTCLRSPAIGAWTGLHDPIGKDDRDVMVEVVTTTFDQHWWRSYAAKLAGRFRQDAIQVWALPVEEVDDDGLTT